MKRILAVLALSLPALAAQAGSAGAGPGGNGAVTIGTLASSVTFDLASAGVPLRPNERELLGSASETLPPGVAGQLLLGADKIEDIFARVSGASDARISPDGQVATSTVTLADGRGAVVMVNRGTRKVTLIRR